MDELKGLIITVFGGDLRMLEHIQAGRAAGASEHYRSVPGAEEAAGRPQARSLKEAVKGAKIITCPIPDVGTDGSLFARYTSEKLLMSLTSCRRSVGALMFTCCATPQFIEWAKGTPVEGDLSRQSTFGMSPYSNQISSSACRIWSPPDPKTSQQPLTPRFILAGTPTWC